MAKSVRVSFIALVTLGILAACSSTDPAPVGGGGVDGGDGDGGQATTGEDAALPVACGRLTTPCPPGGACEGPADCASNVCRDGKCNDVAPADGTQNGDETDVDCGGTKAPACAPGKKCLVPADCTSNVCTGGTCQAPSPTDGVKNGDETGVDCGGTSGKKCPPGQGCKDDADCDNVKCDLAKNECAGPSGSDGLKNGDETDVDCGGSAPTKCAVGKACKVTADCAGVKCNATTLVCDPPSATDGLKNGTETDVDCGGAGPTNAPKCGTGKGCAAGTDCLSKFCGNDAKCEPRKAGRQDGDESDVDCGGTADPDTGVVPPRCADDLKCNGDGDCASTFCSVTSNRCVAGRSCKATVGNATAGIVTCGRRETNNPAKVHESCCRSLPLPASAVRLDKYEITSGRMRQFIESVGPNLRQWVANEIAANTPTGQRLANDIPASVRGLLPASATPGDALNLVMQIGASVMDVAEPSNSQGCYMDYVNETTGSYGANTYYWPVNVLRAHLGNQHKERRFTQAQYDEKPMNCAPHWIYAAFCAWDGGRLPTQAEYNAAWGATAYPWGTNTYSFPVNPANYEDTANYFNNNFSFYGYPGFGDARDLAGLIGAPGRFPKDATAVKSNGESWMDLGANVMELTAPTSQTGGGTFCDVSILSGQPNLGNCTAGNPARPGVIRGTNMPRAGWVGGSWEGHRSFSTNPAAEPWFLRTSYTFGLHVQYGKTGARCAR